MLLRTKAPPPRPADSMLLRTNAPPPRPADSMLLRTNAPPPRPAELMLLRTNAPPPRPAELMLLRTYAPPMRPPAGALTLRARTETQAGRRGAEQKLAAAGAPLEEGARQRAARRWHLLRLLHYVQRRAQLMQLLQLLWMKHSPCLSPDQMRRVRLLQLALDALVALPAVFSWVGRRNFEPAAGAAACAVTLHEPISLHAAVHGPPVSLHAAAHESWLPGAVGSVACRLGADTDVSSPRGSAAAAPARLSVSCSIKSNRHVHTAWQRRGPPRQLGSVVDAGLRGGRGMCVRARPHAYVSQMCDVFTHTQARGDGGPVSGRSSVRRTYHLSNPVGRGHAANAADPCEGQRHLEAGGGKGCSSCSSISRPGIPGGFPPPRPPPCAPSRRRRNSKGNPLHEAET
eukprot:364481-Chlamydomonas_euryale.AAC.2